MTMPTIEARKRHAHRVNGKFAKRPEPHTANTSGGASFVHLREGAVYDPATGNVTGFISLKRGGHGKRPVSEASRRYAKGSVHIDSDGHLRITDEPWLEPVERETWIDWRAVGLALFVLAVLALAAWKAWA